MSSVAEAATSNDEFSAGRGRSFASMAMTPFTCLADLVGEGSPELGSTTRTLGLLARSALESATPEFLSRIADHLHEAGIVDRGAGYLDQLLLPDRLPVPLEEIAEEVRDAFAELRDADIVTADRQGFLCGLINHTAHVLMHDDPGEECIPAVSWTSNTEVPAHFRPMVNELPFRALPGQTMWRAAASLELPMRASTDGCVVECMQPAHRHRGDRIVVEEEPYVPGGVERGLVASKVKRSRITAGYRATINELLVPGYNDNIFQGTDQMVLTIRVREERSRIEARLRRMLEAARPSIEATADDLAKHAVTMINGLAVAGGLLAGVPVWMVTPLILKGARPLFTRICDSLLRAVSEVAFTSWSLGHLTAWAPPVPPVSVWVLMPGDEHPWRLHRLAAAAETALPSATADYPLYARFLVRGRCMMGASGASEARCSRDLWTTVGRLKQPVVWHEPNDGDGNWGFRALVPHAALDGSDGLYVSALRADVSIQPPRWRL